MNISKMKKALLRPASFDEYVGQHDLKENLRVFVGAAKMRDETLRSCFILWSSRTW